MKLQRSLLLWSAFHIYANQFSTRWEQTTRNPSGRVSFAEESSTPARIFSSIASFFRWMNANRDGWLTIFIIVIIDDRAMSKNCTRTTSESVVRFGVRSTSSRPGDAYLPPAILQGRHTLLTEREHRMCHAGLTTLACVCPTSSDRRYSQSLYSKSLLPN